MPEACVLLRPTPSYRPEIFREGLRRLGYSIVPKPKPRPGPEDLLLTWNRKGREAYCALQYERAGAKLLVAENGYLGKAEDGGKLFALALNHHNGAGDWPEGGPERWEGFGIQLNGWRSAGEHILVLPQRGIGPSGVAMPRGWISDVLTRLKRLTDRPVIVRPHPGPKKTEPYEALRGAHAAVTWGSGAGVKALASGVPVFHELRAWIGAPAARFGLDQLEDPFLGDRLPAFHRLAWAQWRAREIESGEAFAWLLRR